MANKKFTELTQASAINETDIVATSQYSGGIWSSLKATILQIANKIVSGINYNSLNTTDKTIIGAINEAAQSGGSGGHTILDDDGTALSQEDNLQFVGVYSEDDSVNDTTKVNIVREMTQAQYDLLSADEKKGIIRITDKNYVCEASEVKFGSGNVEAEVEKKMDWESNGILGAKNFNLYPYNETSHTENGVVWTDIGDGTVKANNKATGNSDFFCHSRVPASVNPLQLPNGKYILTGCPSGGGNSTFLLRIQATLSGSATTIAQDNGNGATFTVNGDDNNTDFAVVTVDCRVVNGYTASDLVFKPMIRRVEDLDNTFQPFSMTNQQLTNVVKGVPSTAGTYTLQATRNSNGTISYSWV